MNRMTWFLEVADRILRSWWMLVAGVCLGLSGSVAALQYLPRIFEASTTIFVAPQQIPQDFVRSTITDDMSIRLASLREAVLSRPYLSKLIERTFGETPDARGLERLIQSMRSRIEVSIIENPRGGGERGSGVFRLTYRDTDAQRAADVVNTLADFYINQNVRFRTTQAASTTRTIESLARELLGHLQTREREVAAFRAGHLYETQAHFNANVQFLQGRQQDLVAVDRDLGAAVDQLEALRAQEAQSALAAGTETGPGVVLDPYTMRLAQLRQEYDALRARYYDEHPDVKAKKREVDDFVASGIPAGSEGEVSAGMTARPLTPLQARIETAEREVSRLRAEQARLREEIDTYKRRLENTPRVEQRLAELTEGLQVLRDRYDDYQGKVEEARGSERIEAAQQGERFEVIERAVPPTSPIRPVPLVIYAFGVAVGLVLFVGPPVLRAFFVPTIRSEAGLREVMGGVPVLVSIPKLVTPEIARSILRRRLFNVTASLVCAAVLAATLGWFGLGR